MFNAVDVALRRAEWQPILFGELNRARLAECESAWPLLPTRVHVHRNHAIEPVSSVVAPFAAWNGMAFEWSTGPYDDSLSFAGNPAADVEIVWLDTTRLTGLAGDGVGAWLVSRLRARRDRTSNPIVVLAWPLVAGDRATIDGAGIPGVHVADLDAIAASCGARWLDPRAASLSGTRLSNHACMTIARELACRWLPACVRPPIKCVVVDLDDTLYAGVLGEDGAAGVMLEEEHRELHADLVSLARSGVLLAIVSRNEPEDVRALFESRPDFTLRLSHFAAVEASWGDKAEAVARVAALLRIGTDAMVVVDDNAGELASLAASTSAVTVQARPERGATRDALRHVAGLWRWRTFEEDGLRADDLAASRERDRITRSDRSPQGYLRELRARLRYHVGMPDTLARIASLAGKTNQFNLSLRRLNEAEIAECLAEHPANVVAIALSDRLSDSGIVAALVGRQNRDVLQVAELFISCRALGRRLEDDMLTRALRLMMQARGIARVRLDVAHGPRNIPARDWLAGYLGLARLPDEACVCVAGEAIAGKPVSDAIDVEIVGAETTQ